MEGVIGQEMVSIMGGHFEWLSGLKTLDASVGKWLLADWAPELSKLGVAPLNRVNFATSSDSYKICRTYRYMCQ
jgi:hypothetical protein